MAIIIMRHAAIMRPWELQTVLWLNEHAGVSA